MFERRYAPKSVKIYVKLKEPLKKEEEIVEDQKCEEIKDEEVDLNQIQEQDQTEQIDSKTESIDNKIENTGETEETPEKSTVNEDFIKEGFILVKDANSKDLPPQHYEVFDKVVFNKANLQVTEVRIQFGE